MPCPRILGENHSEAPELTTLADVAWCDCSNRYVLGCSLSWVLAY